MVSTMGAILSLVLLLLFFNTTSTTGASQDANLTYITIPLNKPFKTDLNREVYGEFIYVNSSSLVKINFTNYENLTFILFQVHSHINSIKLYQNNETLSTEVSGTNIGMVSVIRPYLNDTPRIDEFYIDTNTTTSIKIYISVHAYKFQDPYPGACNTEFKTEIAPYLLVETKDAYIEVLAAAAGLSPNCFYMNLRLTKFYMMYLPEMSFDEEEYFTGLMKMMTLDNIRKYGSLIPQTDLELRRILSAYPGAGVIFVVVAYHDTGYSVYVPNHSYGCTNIDEDGCTFSHDIISIVLCMILMFVGFFINFFGHRFFKTEMFLAGFFSGFIISYILISVMEDTGIGTPALLAASTLSGIFFGAIWLLFWWLYGIPVVAVLLPALNFGFLLAAIFYYTVSVDHSYLVEDINFWTLFNLIMILSALAMVFVTYAANILSCAVLGAFGTVYAMDYYVGSNLKYIMINSVRRAVVPTYKYAVIAPPFQEREITMSVLWISLACLGWIYQQWDNYGRPPFPPPPRSTRLAVQDDHHVTRTTYGTVTTSPRQQVRESISNRISRYSAAFKNYLFTDNSERSTLIA